MRIIGGKLRGRKLIDCSKLKSLRPTTDRNREALFNLLAFCKTLQGFKLDGAKVLDVCCGSGAVAFEALSRGAKSAVLIDNNSLHLELAKKNAENLQLTDRIQFILANADGAIPKLSTKFDLVFIDPPYDHDGEAIVRKIVEAKCASNLVVLESRAAPILPELTVLDQRKYGQTILTFIKA